jgi:DNA-binding GntR family transcriptional regulator
MSRARGPRGASTVDRVDRVASATVHRGSPVPLHVQIRAHILELIEDGELAPGHQVPTERELADRFGVSLAPVRQAILDLAKEGYLVRARGKGTFVREQPVLEDIAILTSFTESMRAKGIEPEMRILRQALVPTPPDVGRGLRTRERRLILLERLALVDGVPVALLAAYLPPARFPKLLDTALEGRSLYRTLREQDGTTMSKAESILEVARCDAANAGLLGIAAGTPVLQVDGLTFDQRDQPVEFSRVRYRTDRFRFRLDSFLRSDRVIHLIDGERAAGAPE